MGNLLISYASREGQTARIANRIAEQARAMGYKVDVRLTTDLDRLFSLVDYDAIIIGAPVHRAKFPRDTSRFIRSHLDELIKIKSAFFSVSLTAVSSEPEDKEAILQLTNQFLQSTGWMPGRIETFAGALLYSRYNPLLRFVMKMLVKSHDGDTDTSRDYEYTNWDSVQKFTRELLGPP